MFLRLILPVTLCFSLQISAALADPSDDRPTYSGDPNYAAAVQLVKKENFTRAIPLLQKVVGARPNDANAWNYLGFSNRKLGNTQLAIKQYKRALAIDPDHLGANEYLGELYVENGNMALARERLAVLDKACFWGCDEYDDLKAMIEAKGG